MNDAALESSGGGLRAVAYAEFAEKAVDVSFNGRFRNEQVAPDFFVAFA